MFKFVKTTYSEFLRKAKASCGNDDEHQRHGQKDLILKQACLMSCALRCSGLRHQYVPNTAPKLVCET